MAWPDPTGPRSARVDHCGRRQRSGSRPPQECSPREQGRARPVSRDVITRSSWACEAELALISQATFLVTFECLAELLSKSLSESGSLQSPARARPTFVATARQPNTSRLPKSLKKTV